MDPSSVQMGLTAAGLLSTFFSKSVAELGKKTVDSGFEYLFTLVRTIRKRFHNDQGALNALASLEQKPEDVEASRIVAEKVTLLADRDPGFKDEFLVLTRSIAQTADRAQFRNDVWGNIEKLIQIGTNYGSINM